jgi:NPCBM/NEW2 domain
MFRRRLRRPPSWALRAGVAALVVLTGGTCLSQSPAKSPGSQLILLDGSAIPFQSLEIAGGKLSGRGVPQDLTLDDLRRIELPAPAIAAPEIPAVVVELRGGGRILGKNVAIGHEKCQLAWRGGDRLSLAIDLLRAVRFDPATVSPDFERALAAPAAQWDRAFFKDEAGKLSSVTGLVDSLSEQELTLEVGGQMRQLPRSRLFGIIAARPVATESVPPCLVAFHDGSALGGETLSLSGGKATLDFTAGDKAEFPWSIVSRVTIRSSRVAFLSDLKPTAEEQQTLVTLPRPWQRDKCVMGKPLTLGTRVYEKGIGVHARSLLTFAAEKKWDTLAATIGLDAAAGGKGDCVFTVLADGQPLVARRMTGTDPPHEIQVSIAGKEQVMLLVEPGEGLDLGDHADWCDVRFIKNRPGNPP